LEKGEEGDEEGKYLRWRISVEVPGRPRGALSRQRERDSTCATN
jgi:hypothetical protein